MPTLLQRLEAIVAPVVEAEGLELFDLTYGGGTVQVTIDRPTPTTPDDGIDLSDLTAVTRAVSRALDEHDPIPDRYSLEVSTPGLERTLRTPRHFERAVGETVSIKLAANAGDDRRLKGRLVRAGADEGDGIDVEVEGGAVRTVAYADIDKARTVFEWGPEPRPSSKSGRRPAGGAAKPKDPKKPTKKVDAR